LSQLDSTKQEFSQLLFFDSPEDEDSAKKKFRSLKQAAAEKEALYFILLLGTKGNACPSVFV